MVWVCFNLIHSEGDESIPMHIHAFQTEEEAKSMQNYLRVLYVKEFYREKMELLEKHKYEELTLLPFERKEVRKDVFQESRPGQPYRIGQFKFYTADQANRFLGMLKLFTSQELTPETVNDVYLLFDPNLQVEFVVMKSMN